MASKQTLGIPHLSGQTVDELRASTEFWLRQLVTHVDQAVGARGTPTFHNDVDLKGHRLTTMGIPVAATDAQRFDLCLHTTTPGGDYTAQGRQILDVKTAATDTQAVNLGQLLAVVEAATLNIQGAAFVVATASSELTAERALTAEASVLTVTDNGANSTIVVGVATNGIGDIKLRQGAATSVVGRAANSLGNVADIAASADNQLLQRVAGALTWTAIPTLTTVTTTGQVQVGGDLNHDGANMGVFGTAPVAQQTSGANLTNNITAGGTNNVVDNWTDLTTYATDAAAIRNAVYQLARTLKITHDALRAYGMLT